MLWERDNFLGREFFFYFTVRARCHGLPPGSEHGAGAGLSSQGTVLPALSPAGDTPVTSWGCQICHPIPSSSWGAPTLPATESFGSSFKTQDAQESLNWGPATHAGGSVSFLSYSLPSPNVSFHFFSPKAPDFKQNYHETP